MAPCDEQSEREDNVVANKRYDAKRDDTEPGIVQALRKAGWHVWRDLPVDLLCWHPAKGYRLLECKSVGKPLKPKAGPQAEFVGITGCPIVNSAKSALDALRD